MELNFHHVIGLDRIVPYAKGLEQPSSDRMIRRSVKQGMSADQPGIQQWPRKRANSSPKPKHTMSLPLSAQPDVHSALFASRLMLRLRWLTPKCRSVVDGQT